MKYRILYVDDEVDNLIAFKAVFRRTYDIDVANSAEEALSLVADQTYSVVISDQRMPNTTGVEFFEQLRSVQPEAIRMVLTGYSDLNAIIDAINKGNIYYYISKPWKAKELQLIIDKAIETYELRENYRALEKENVLAQFKILRNQINPHFLFNSMNILGSLIHLDPDKAVEFTRMFSKLYRKVLELKDEAVISVAEELEFVNAYLHLQKIRFDESLKVIMDIPDYALNKTLPPFALQMIIENAIKHNIVSVDKPLNIKISCEKELMTITNNLQVRSLVKDSTGTGLSNLNSRYQLLGGDLPSFQSTQSEYIAQLPLIE